jgi:hypothetical protein
MRHRDNSAVPPQAPIPIGACRQSDAMFRASIIGKGDSPAICRRTLLRGTAPGNIERQKDSQ